MKEVKRTRNVPSRNDARTANGVRHRKRRKRSYTLYYLLLLFFVLISGFTLSVTVFFNIDTIMVEGTAHYTAQQVIDQSGIKKGNNLFRISLDKSEKKIVSALKDIDSVKIERKFPNSLMIRVSEASAAYFADNNGSYITISTGGRVLKTDAAEDETKGIIRLVGFDGSKAQTGSFFTAESNPQYALLDKLMNVLKKYELSDITQVDLTSDVNLTIQYQGRFEIKLGSMSELSYKVKFAKNILDTKLDDTEEGVIDAASPGKVYFTPKSIQSSAVSSDDRSSSLTQPPQSSPSASSGTGSQPDADGNTASGGADTSHQ